MQRTFNLISVEVDGIPRAWGRSHINHEIDSVLAQQVDELVQRVIGMAYGKYSEL